MMKLTRFTQIVLLSFFVGNLVWLFYPRSEVSSVNDNIGIIEEEEEIKEGGRTNSSDKTNSSEPEEKARVIRSTKTRVKSKILPSGGLLEQTVTTEVTETFSSTLCVPGLQKCQVN